MPPTEPISFDVLIERDLNILLLEESRLSSAFQNWLVSKLTNNKMSLKRFISTTHLAASADLGSVDILILFENDKDRRCALLIENKMDRPQEPVTAHRYFEFGERGLTEGSWDEYLTCLIAPQNYFETLSEADYFSGYLSYEELADWFAEAQQSDSSLPPFRAAYKEELVRFALQQWNNIVAGLAASNNRAGRYTSHPVAPPVAPHPVAPPVASHSSRGRRSTAYRQETPSASTTRHPPELTVDAPTLPTPAPAPVAPPQPQEPFVSPAVLPTPVFAQQPMPALQQQPAQMPVFMPQESMLQQQMPAAMPTFMPQSPMPQQQPVMAPMPAFAPYPQPMPASPDFYQMPPANAFPADAENQHPFPTEMPAAQPLTQTEQPETKSDETDAAEASDFSDFKLYPAGMLNLPPDYDEKSDSVMSVFTHDYQVLANETHPKLGLQPLSPVTEQEEVIEFIPAEFADGIKIVHRLRAGAVDLFFSGASLAAIEGLYKPFGDGDISFKEIGAAAAMRIGVPLIDPQRGVESQKDLVSFALGKAQKLYALYLRTTEEPAAAAPAKKKKKTAAERRLSDDNLFF